MPTTGSKERFIPMLIKNCAVKIIAKPEANSRGKFDFDSMAIFKTRQTKNP
jgi:hypothetical protein